MSYTSRFVAEENCNELLNDDGNVVAKSYDPMLTTYLESNEFEEAFEQFQQDLIDEINSIEMQEDEEEDDDEDYEDDGE